MGYGKLARPRRPKVIGPRVALRSRCPSHHQELCGGHQPHTRHYTLGFRRIEVTDLAKCIIIGYEGMRPFLERHDGTALAVSLFFLIPGAIAFVFAKRPR